LSLQEFCPFAFLSSRHAKRVAIKTYKPMVAVFVSGMRLYIKTWKNRSKSLRLGILSFKEYVSLQAHGDSRWSHPCQLVSLRSAGKFVLLRFEDIVIICFSFNFCIYSCRFLW
jgi:hypothetical protein